MKKVFTIVFGFIISIASSQTILKPDRVFDGTEIHEGWVVLVEGNKIIDVGPSNRVKIPNGTKEIILRK